ncbi:MAG: GlsB/YeaQ/YmgE family stress response membrane protein [Actinomycetota bacterium]|nr:GlsB/YeaQ/YmgE family stress response membrane protein [Actinomycetota bacterium]
MIGALLLGLVAGFIARALMPGRDAMGLLATLLLGLAGALVGFLLFTEVLGIGDNKAFDLGGLVGAVIGSMLLLGVYRMFTRNREHGHSGRAHPVR